MFQRKTRKDLILKSNLLIFKKYLTTFLFSVSYINK